MMVPLVYVLLILLATSMLTLLERYILAVVQSRCGPDKWLLGFIQPVLDGLKLFATQHI
jgi:NADH:ubiquinone oxidoreductase subunit H